MATAGLERYRHPAPAFEIDLPTGFEVGVMPGVLVVARAPEAASASPFRANLTVVAQQLPPGVDPVELSDGSLAEQARTFPGWRLIDRAEARLGELHGRAHAGDLSGDPRLGRRHGPWRLDRRRAVARAGG